MSSAKPSPFGKSGQNVPGPVTTGSQRRKLLLKLSQKDALQALFQAKPYPRIATRERLPWELGIAQSRVQETQQERPGESGQSFSPSQTRYLVQTFTRDLFQGITNRKELARHMGIPETRIQVSSPVSPWAQDVAQESGGFSPAERLELDAHMVSKLKSLEPTAETKRARQWLGPRAKQHSSHDYSCSRGPKGPTRCSELLFPLLTLPARGEHSTIGRGKIETQGSSGRDSSKRKGKGVSSQAASPEGRCGGEVFHTDRHPGETGKTQAPVGRTLGQGVAGRNLQRERRAHPGYIPVGS
ncbi:hypothetical protein JEQ12_003457 [Ovis aries]|uniref:Homeobox domain-containing protein n=1 Tax=Ovis aries TaxID=9940 RepID=A0A836CWW4_SHEEP|nr:hypothetical protein JEQ12_003457 [Ovis aries]